MLLGFQVDGESDREYNQNLGKNQNTKRKLVNCKSYHLLFFIMLGLNCIDML